MIKIKITIFTICCFIFLFFAPICFGAFYPLEITNIKPSGTGDPKISPSNRIFHAYPGIEYNIGVATIGGSYPYFYKLLNAPKGMVVHNSTGEVSWKNPQEDADDIILIVTDSDGNSVKTSWSISVSKDRFIFVDESYRGMQIGNYEHPFSSLKDLLINVNSYENDSIVYFRQGKYFWVQTGDKTREMNLNNKPCKWISYPNEKVFMNADQNFIRIYEGDGIYFDGLYIYNMLNHGINGQGGFNYQTIRRCVWDGIKNEEMINNNYGFIHFNSGCPGSFALIQDNLFENYDGTGAIGSMYNMHKALIERNIITNELYNSKFTYNASVNPKSLITRLTVRGNKIFRKKGVFIGSGGDQNSIFWGSDGIEICWNFFSSSMSDDYYLSHVFNTRIDYQDKMSTCRVYNDPIWGVTKNIFYYRNTLNGTIGFDYIDGLDPLRYGGCNFQVLDNVIINSNTYPGSHDFIVYSKSRSENNPWRLIYDHGNLKALPNDNIIDSSGRLIALHNKNIGKMGWQFQNGATPIDFFSNIYN